jgi:hypothetical protein
LSLLCRDLGIRSARARCRALLESRADGGRPEADRALHAAETGDPEQPAAGASLGQLPGGACQGRGSAERGMFDLNRARRARLRRGKANQAPASRAYWRRGARRWR